MYPLLEISHWKYLTKLPPKYFQITQNLSLGKKCIWHRLEKNLYPERSERSERSEIYTKYKTTKWPLIGPKVAPASAASIYKHHMLCYNNQLASYQTKSGTKVIWPILATTDTCYDNQMASYQTKSGTNGIWPILATTDTCNDNQMASYQTKSGAPRVFEQYYLLRSLRSGLQSP